MDKHGGIGLLIGVSPEKGDASDESEATRMAAKAMLKAIKREDPDALAKAFEQLLCCVNDEQGDKEEPESDDEDSEDLD